ncbi:hypothetical protein AKJ16_DCAP20285 [Drosera capensis]
MLQLGCCLWCLFPSIGASAHAFSGTFEYVDTVAYPFGNAVRLADLHKLVPVVELESPLLPSLLDHVIRIAGN